MSQIEDMESQEQGCVLLYYMLVWYKPASSGREGQWKPALIPEGAARGPKGRFSLTLPTSAGRFIILVHPPRMQDE